MTGFLYVSESMASHSRKTNIYFSGERYTPNHSDQWHEISEMFSPRSNFATVILDDMIFVIGGYNGMPKETICISLIYYSRTDKR